MAISKYQTIVDVIKQPTPLLAITATYKQDPVPRFLFPHVIGHSGPDEMVLCCHYDDPNLDPTKKHYRCFKLNDLNNVTPVQFAPKQRLRPIN